MPTFLGMDIVSWMLQIIATAGSWWGIRLCRDERLLCWKVWMAANLFWFALFVYSGLWISLFQPVIYNIENWRSYKAWKKRGIK